MKTITLTLALLLSSSAFARSLNCKITSQNNYDYMPANFQIMNIDDKFPEVSDFDGGNMAEEEFPFAYSNECDNWMEMSFPSSSFDLLRQNEIHSLNGVMYYSQSEIDETSPGAVQSPYNEGEYMVIMQFHCELE